MNRYNQTNNGGHGNRTRVRHGLAPALVVTLLLRALCGGAATTPPGPSAGSTPPPLNSERLYQQTNIWTIHLKFAPDQWEAMEPKGGGNPFGGGPRGGGESNAGRMLTPVFMSQADSDRDGRISRAEFVGLGERWFKAWDSAGAGRLTESQIRTGLDAIRTSGGGFGMMLQGPEGKRNGIASAFGIEFDYVRADLEFEGRLLKEVGIRFKGNGTFLESRNSLKRSLKVQLDKFVKGQALGEVKTLTLQNNVTDPSLMNEVLAYRLYRDAGVPAPRTAYGRVFVTVPGKFDRKYFGLYSLSESVDKQFARRHLNTKSGVVLKPVTSDLFADLGADWSAYTQTYDPKTALSEADQRRVTDLCRLATQADDASFAAQIADYLDLPEFARFMAVMVYLSDLDGILGPGQNFYLLLNPKTRKFQFTPWDQDHSWGQFDRASQEQRNQLSIHHPWQGENRFLERVFGVEAFKKAYLARLEEFSQSLFAPTRLARQVDEIAAAIRPAVQEESEAKLSRFDKAVAGELLTGGGFGPFGGGRTQPIKPFTQVRTASVKEQLAGKSQGLLLSDGGFMGGGPGRRGGSGLGAMLSRSWTQLLDQDKDASVTQAEFAQGFSRLFDAWNIDHSGRLTLAQVRAGIGRSFAAAGNGFPPFGGGNGPAGEPGPHGPAQDPNTQGPPHSH